ncbi:Kiwa anti-phage protein KwaB-like domain-containing protein [Devosia riboflavina]
MAFSLNDFHGFDTENAALSFWVFKKSTSPKTKAPVFTGHWIDLTSNLESHLRTVVAGERARVTETKAYSLLAQNNENSALTIGADETLADLVVQNCGSETQARKADKLRDINNADFYVIKLVVGDKVLHAVRRTETGWKARKAAQFLNVIWSDEKLDLEEDRAFQISRNVDFIVFDGQVLISNKNNFESVLNFREAHIQDFSQLRLEQDFKNIFSNDALLSEYVGTNKTHLRRIATIRQKGHYKDPIFMSSLIKNRERLKYEIQFDATGRIVPTAETCAQIITALLDHRLLSHMEVVFEVDDAAKVG